MFWTIQAAIKGGKAFEIGLIDRAFASDDASHLVALEAASRKYG